MPAIKKLKNHSRLWHPLLQELLLLVISSLQVGRRLSNLLWLMCLGFRGVVL